MKITLARLTLVFSLMPVMAAAQTSLPTMNGTAKTAAIFSVLIHKCPNTDLDVSKAKQHEQELIQIGENVWTKLSFGAQLVRERQRTLDEANKAGPAWCDRQKAQLSLNGFSDAFSATGEPGRAYISSLELKAATAEGFRRWEHGMAEHGESGIIPKIEECYENLGEVTQQKEAAICIAMDHLARTMAEYIHQVKGFRLNPFFETRNFVERTYLAASRSTPQSKRVDFVRSVADSADGDFKHFYEMHKDETPG